MQPKDNLTNIDTDITNSETDITPEEIELLDSASDEIDEDDLQLKRAQLDGTDNEGTPLNERASATDISGEDLDVPGSELDDSDEAIGEEDEENNSYSQADTK